MQDCACPLRPAARADLTSCLFLQVLFRRDTEQFMVRAQIRPDTTHPMTHHKAAPPRALVVLYGRRSDPTPRTLPKCHDSSHTPRTLVVLNTPGSPIFFGGGAWGLVRPIAVAIGGDGHPASFPFPIPFLVS